MYLLHIGIKMKATVCLLALLFVGEIYSLKDNVPTTILDPSDLFQNSSGSPILNPKRLGVMETTAQSTSTASASETASTSASTPMISAPDAAKSSGKSSEVALTFALETEPRKIPTPPLTSETAPTVAFLLALNGSTLTNSLSRRERFTRNVTASPINSAPDSEKTAKYVSETSYSSTSSYALESETASETVLLPEVNKSTITISTSSSTIHEKFGFCVRTYDGEICNCLTFALIAFLIASTVVILFYFLKLALYMHTVYAIYTPVRIIHAHVIEDHYMYPVFDTHQCNTDVKTAEDVNNKF